MSVPAGASSPAAAADPVGCSYGTPGPSANSICWLDLTAFNQAVAGSSAGQNMAISLRGGYTATFNFHVTGATYTTSALPRGSGYLGRGSPDAANGYPVPSYLGTTGRPAIGRSMLGSSVAEVRNFQILDSAGLPVSGYALVSADAESTANQETLTFTSNTSISKITGFGQGCNAQISGLGTTTVQCRGLTNSYPGAYGTALFRSVNSTFMSARMADNTNIGVQAVAFGVQLAAIRLNKTVASRFNPSDSFETSVTSPQGTTLGNATTGAAGTTSSTGVAEVIPPGAGQSYTLSEAMSPGSASPLAAYLTSWSCSNSRPGASTVLPSGSGTQKAIVPQVGDDIVCTITNTAQAPAIGAVKSASPSDAASFTVGRLITYTFVATNSGNVTLTDPTIREGTFTGSGTLSPIACPPTPSLAPGGQLTCTATYTITQADVDQGEIVNDVTATGTPPAGPDVVSPLATVTIPGDQSPAITLVKSAAPTQVTAAGQTVAYSFVVTNTGNVTVHAASVTETAFSGARAAPVISCPLAAASLVPGAFVTCTAPYTVAQADVDAGQITNTATATASAPDGSPVNAAPADAIVTAAAAPAIALVKTAAPTQVTAAGQTVTYSFLVTNAGNVTLHAASVTETAFSGTGPAPVISCPSAAASLAPTASVICTAPYTVTQADVDAGQITNTATTTASAPDDSTVSSAPADAVVTAPAAAAIGVVKSASPSDAASFTVGRLITYTFVATNTGNVTLTDPTIREGTFTGSGTLSPIACPPTPSLAPGGQLTCTATYTITQADVDQGEIVNDVTATGTPPAGPDVVSPLATVTIAGDPPPVDTPSPSPSPSPSAAAMATTGLTIHTQLLLFVTLTGLGIIAIVVSRRRRSTSQRRPDRAEPEQSKRYS
ncbi:DUF7507 domain-containing protein [Agromyces ramosus]|uniref:DUF7507 domain-containing protein n=1 Tax=Agromyces ramosus TaxID=33879 RepID=UPI0027D773F4|nr:hypothetical protein [Agromyces ramosus]